jgi:hypothetical protein
MVCPCGAICLPLHIKEVMQPVWLYPRACPMPPRGHQLNQYLHAPSTIYASHVHCMKAYGRCALPASYCRADQLMHHVRAPFLSDFVLNYPGLLLTPCPLWPPQG